MGWHRVISGGPAAESAWRIPVPPALGLRQRACGPNTELVRPRPPPMPGCPLCLFRRQLDRPSQTSASARSNASGRWSPRPCWLPVVTTLLYMLVFVVATGVSGTRASGLGVDFAHFVGPGLIMMSIMNNAFANSSSSLLQAKMMGLTPGLPRPRPCHRQSRPAALAAGAVTRMLVGAGQCGGGMGLYAVSESPICGRCAVFRIWRCLAVGPSWASSIGLWSEKFDQLAAASTSQTIC